MAHALELSSTVKTSRREPTRKSIAEPAELGTLASVTLALTVAVLALTATTAYPCLRWAANRTRHQPLDNPVDEENTVLGTLIADPDAYQHATTLSAEDLTRPDHRRAWQLLVQHAGPCPHAPERTAPCGCEITVEQHQKAQDAIAAENGSDYIAGILPHATQDTEAFISAGERLLVAREDRELSGAVPIRLDADGTPYRDGPRTSGVRLWFMAAILGLGLISAAATSLAAQYPTPLGTALAGTGLVVLAYGSVLWAFVDHDTLYIDTPTLLVLGAISWALVAAAAVVSGEPARLIPGAGIAVAVIVLFEGTNLLYRILRGRHGLGGGDSKLAIVTVGVPAAALGAWNYGYGILLVSLVLAVCAYPILKVLGHEGRNIPFAFGPYLATGWIAMGLTLPVTFLLGGTP